MPKAKEIARGTFQRDHLAALKSALKENLRGKCDDAKGVNECETRKHKQDSGNVTRGALLTAPQGDAEPEPTGAHGAQAAWRGSRPGRLPALSTTVEIL